MGKQTSRMYGVKKKTRVNYYEFGDESNGWSITIYFSSGVWTVKAGGTLNDPGHLLPKGQCSWWMNGTEYHKGDTIVTFNEGDEVTYHIMEQHRDTTPYTNYMYDIYGNAATNVNYGNKEVEYKLVTTSTTDHEFKVIKYENGIPNSTRKVSDKEIIKYKERYSEIYENPQYKVFNLIFDWHGTNPESGHVPMSFECISNSNYISYNGNPKSINQTIFEWQAVNNINETIKDDTNKHQAQGAIKSEKPTVALVKRQGGYLKGRQELTSETIMHDVMYDHKEAYYNGHYHKAMYLVYDNPGIQDCWTKKIKNALALTYADPFWFLMTTTAGVEYNGTTYEARKLIRSWKPETSVNMTLTQTISKAKVIPEDEYSDKFVYTVFSEDGSNDVGVYYKQAVPVEDEEGEIVDSWTTIDSEAFGTSDSPVTYKKIGLIYSNGTWTIVSKGAHIVHNGKTYKSNKVIAKFTAGTSYTIDIGDESSRYSSDNYEHIVYDIEELENVDSLTVKKQIVTNVKDSEGHTTKHYTDLDSITFSSGESPVTFYNIQFKASNGKWTIYSKCGYIKFSGRLYPKNRSILSFNVSERIHIEIADETDKYEVTEVRTYKIETPLSSENVAYEIHTSELTREMKIVKNNNGVEEPWISLKSYQAEYVPYVVDDVSFLYFNKTRTWELYSNSDNLYYNGTNYKLGELLASWGYLDNFKISGISVSKPSTDAIQVTTRIKKSSGTVVSNNDVNEDIAWYDEEYPDFNVSFSFKKKIWVFTALRTCWSNGIRYEDGDTIASFKTKIDVDPFSIMCTHGESGTIENILYSVSVMVGTFDGITNVNISSQSRGDITLTDKDISKNGDEVLLLDKNQLKSMYGYIWKKDGSPGPTPPAKNYNYDIFALAERTDGNYYKYILAIDSTYGSRYARRVQIITGYNYTRLSRASIGLPQGAPGAATTDSVYDNMASSNTSYEYCLYSSGAGSEPYASRYSTSGSSLLSQGFGFLNQQGNLNTVLVSHPYNEPETLIITKRSFNRSSMTENVTNTTYPGYFVNLSDYVGYIFENNSLLMRRYPLISTWRRPVDVQNQKHGAKINLSDLSVEELYDPYVINLDSIIESVWESMSEAQQRIYGRIYNFEEDWRSTVNLQTGNEVLMYIGTGLMSSSSQEEDCQEFWYYDLYKFNFKSGVLTYLASTSANNPGSASLRAIAQNVFSWMRDPRNGKRYFASYTYAKTQDERGYWTWKADKLRIFEAADESIDSILSATVVNEISADSLASTTVNIWRLDTNTYQEFTMGELLSIEYIKTVGYTKSSGLFKGGKDIYGLYGYKNTNAYSSSLYLDKWVIFLSDPTLRDLTGSFCFLLTSFRNKTYIDEHDYRPNPESH